MKANLLLSAAAVIWGVAFIAQRMGMDHLAPLTFGGLRFLLGGLCLFPAAFYLLRRSETGAGGGRPAPRNFKLLFWGGLGAGLLLFGGVTLQQYGLVWTTAGKAGFITGLYVVIVPLGARLMGQPIARGTLLGVALAVTGLYFLSVGESFRLAPGDGLILLGAVVWAIHLLFLGWISPLVNSWMLAALQAIWCGIFSLLAAFIFDPPPLWTAIEAAWLPLVWGGLMSVALGYTFQVVGQKEARPVPAAVILQLEAVVAALCGWIFLRETMTGRMLLGAAAMLAGMLVSQLWPRPAPERARDRR